MDQNASANGRQMNQTQNNRHVRRIREWKLTSIESQYNAEEKPESKI